jgi:hypothetical protein
MYLTSVLALLLVFPLLSIGIQSIAAHAPVLPAVLAKWFVFWAVGVRMLIAGLRQIFQPRYTAQSILGIRDASAHIVVRELGIANTSIGALGIATLMVPAWLGAAALGGGIFYGLAGINHARHAGRSFNQNVAMVTDLLAALALAALFA